ncbi:hypothetical protein [Specibacter sp. RAF43]|uniref:hypothetical protein n=1 Tax=Specibacter sp. RAF43 TaxID=3233057 RepID=UPI003F952BD3
MDAEPLLRWQEALDQLQQHAERAIEMARNRRNLAATDGMEGDWAPPADLGALPAALARRARQLVTLQEQAAGLVRKSRSAVEHELAALTESRTEVQPIYVDVIG